MHDERDDYEDARRLLAPLAGGPYRPTAVDIGRAMADGRRRMRARRATNVGGIAAVTALVLATVPSAVTAVRGTADQPAPGVMTQGGPAAARGEPPTAPTRCEARLLPVPDGATSSVVTDADPTGRYLVGFARDDQTGRGWALLWEDGRSTVLDIPVTADGGQTLVVNSSGTVAGSGAVRDGRDGRGAGNTRHTSWVYQDGSYAELPRGGDYDVADINTDGDILGSDNGVYGDDDIPRYDADDHPRSVAAIPPVSQHPPVIWPADDRDAMRELAVPDDAEWVTASGIDDDGTVVGSRLEPAPRAWDSTGGPASPVGEDAASTRSAQRALVWAPDGDLSELRIPRGSGPSANVSDIRNGWVVGGLYDPAERGRAGRSSVSVARWHLPGGEVSTGSGLAQASAVNAHGWLAGHSETNGTEHAALQLGDRVLKLPEPPEAEPTVDGTGAVAISDHGRVAGGYVQVPGERNGEANGWVNRRNAGDKFTEGVSAAVRWTCR